MVKDSALKMILFSTKELTEKIVETIQSLTTKLPQIQIADYRRLFIDYNRKEDCAFVNSGSARTEYLKYHTGIRDKNQEMLSNDGTSLLILFDFQ